MPLQCVRKLRILRNWMKLLSSNFFSLNSCYVNETLCKNKNKCKNWAVEIKNMLSSIGLMSLWVNQFFEKPDFLKVAKQRIFINYKQFLLADINAFSKCTIYKYLIDHSTLHSYLTKRIS